MLSSRTPARLPIALGLALGLTGLAGIAFPSPSAAAGSAEPPGPSIHYQEALAHQSDRLTFTPGAVVSVPYRPRAGDTTPVDGQAPVALPAGNSAPTINPLPGSVTPAGTLNVLRRESYGFLPYWELGSTLNYDALSTIAYFGVGLNVNLSNPGDPTIGTLSQSGNGWAGWTSDTMTSAINTAHAHGTRVALTIQSFAWDGTGASYQSQILGTDAIRLRTAQSIAAEVARRGVDGVNLDFEPIASGQSSNYVTFVRELRAALDAVHAGYELTFCATGSIGNYDLPGLTAAGAADAVFIMDYDFRGTNPPNTGSIDPLTSPYIRYTLTYVVTSYLATGIPPSKVIMGLPWYGHAWSTGGPDTCAPCQALNAPLADESVYGSAAQPYYSGAADLSATKDATHLGKMYDTGEQTAWTAYYGTFGGGSQPTWRQLYFDDAQAFGVKIDAAISWNLRGVGMWALGYDNNDGNGDLTAMLAQKLQTGVTAASYHVLTPTRLLDSRDGTGGLSGPFTSRAARTFQVTSQSGIVPQGATAVTGNLTVTQQTGNGYLYLGPTPINDPTSSTLNFPVADDRANAVTVALSTTGSLSVTYASSVPGATAHVVFDVSGYYSADASGATFTGLTPTRLLDTRDGTGGLSGAFTSRAARTFTVARSGGPVPANAVAVAGNLTVTQQTGNGYLYLGPAPVNNPTSSTLNFPTGDDRANAVYVALGDGGTLSITYATPVAGGTAHVVFDVTGYFSPDPAGAMFIPLMPGRILDTRDGTGGLSGLFASRVAQTFSATRAGTGVPANATAVTGNLTVTQQSGLGYLFIGPAAMNNPTSSNLNFPRYDDRANAVTVALGSGGTLAITYATPVAGAGAHVIFDVTGYFVHPA
jgi:spore germination protein YaaH/serine protease inhibitor ecotin